MFVAIGEGILAAVEFVAGAWETIKEIRVIGKVAGGVVCALQWAGYVSLILTGIELLSGLGIPKLKILDLLGISNLVDGNKSIDHIKEQLSKSLGSLSETIKASSEIDARLRMAPSPWNGVHKPPYHSIAIHEVVYEFSNVLGSGNMIIIFNPEGFGMKPRAPQIIRYVDEAEFAEFTNSESWGNYWRINYLLGKRRKRHRTTQEKDVLTGDYQPSPDAEGLDDYIERVLELPEYADDVIAGEFKEQIIYAFEKQEDLTTTMLRAIEKGNIGRGVEENGLRVTNMLNQKLSNVPENLKRIVATNPVFKDVAKVLPAYKKAIGRLRNVKSKFLSARNLSSYSAEAVAISSTLGTFGNIQATLGVATDFGVKLGADLTIEAVRTGAAVAPEFLAANRDLLMTANEFGQLEENINKIYKSLDDLGTIGGEGLGFGNYDKAVDIIGDLNNLLGEIGIDVPAELDAEKVSELIENLFDEKQGNLDALKKGILSDLFSASTLADLGIGLIKPPTCIPFIK